MARKERRDSSKLRELMDEYGVKTMEDVLNIPREIERLDRANCAL